MKHRITLYCLLTLLAVAAIPVVTGCGEKEKASVQVMRKKLADKIAEVAGKGDVAIQMYENRVKAVQEHLIKLKMRKKVIDSNLEEKQARLDSLQDDASATAAKKRKLLETGLGQMKEIRQSLGEAETKVQDTLKSMKDNLELLKIKVEVLESKKGMLEAVRDATMLSRIQEEVTGTGNEVDSAIDSLEKDVFRLEAEVEVEELLSGT